MTRIAVLADIHGNLPALEAVIEDLAEQSIDEVLVGGDLVGRGPQGSAVARRIRELGWPSVRGNHEDYLLDFRRGNVPDDWLVTAPWAASRWMAAELSDEDAEYIDSLPFTLSPEVDAGLRVFHGSPAAIDDGLGVWSPDDVLSRHLRGIEESVLVCCHTHRPMIREVPEGRVVNVGSVGLPFNGDRRAQYAIFERVASERSAPERASSSPGGEGVSQVGRWEVEPRQVPYRLEDILEVYESSGFEAEGGVTARLLRMELEHAAPYLVPFLKWAHARGIEPAAEEIPAFERFYRPGESLGSFFRRLAAVRPD